MSFLKTTGGAPHSDSERANWSRYKLTLQYVGSRYHGWQVQPDYLTVQEVLQTRLTHLAGLPIQVTGASRTDSGVHALGQVAHFDFPPKASIPDLKQTLNAILPWDIRAFELTPVSNKFHAQRNATRKRYHYRIYTGPVFPPFEHNLALHHPGKLDFKHLQEAATLLKGSRDFTGFAASSTTVKNRKRTIFEAKFRGESELLIFVVEANGFLHHMVRNIVGTLLQIGGRKRQPDSIREIIGGRDRTLAGPTAPAEGLYLVRIWY